MICPKCGENNSDNFRYCGMCGTPLEARRPAGATVPAPSPVTPPPPPRITNAQDSLRTVSVEKAASRGVENTARPGSRPVPPISGLSMLGLNQPGPSESAPIQSSPIQPSVDALRESFSGLDSFFEPEPQKSGVGRTFLLLVLLAALAVAGWWTYSNLGAVTTRKPETPAGSTTDAARITGDTPGNPPSTSESNTPKDKPTTPNAASSQAAPSAAVPEGPSENATPIPDTTTKDTAPKAAETKPATKATPVIPKAARREAQNRELQNKDTDEAKKITDKRDSRATSAKSSQLPGAATDSGDAAFRQGEAYLYGRGVRENCDEAVKYLKDASAKSSAKARSAFGTMYATGHCVPRDLPTSYVWFALALRLDPNNQILEKDLNAVWSQMTPPERQMATRMKQ
ncbi:MAG: zinc-ribbon domain-containing protein [Terriglobales bacterium]